MFLHKMLTFYSMRLMAMGSGGLLGLMLHGVVVFVKASCDGCICTIYVICLADTWKGQEKEEILLGSVDDAHIGISISKHADIHSPSLIITSTSG